MDTTWNLTADAGTGRSAASAVTATGSLGTELEAYFAELRRRLRAALETPPGVSEELVATVDVLLAADGSLSHAHIAKSSGSAEFDRAVLVAIGRTRMSARPDGKSEVMTIPFTTHRGTRR